MPYFDHNLIFRVRFRLEPNKVNCFRVSFRIEPLTFAVFVFAVLVDSRRNFRRWFRQEATTPKNALWSDPHLVPPPHH